MKHAYNFPAINLDQTQEERPGKPLGLSYNISLQPVSICSCRITCTGALVHTQLEILVIPCQPPFVPNITKASIKPPVKVD